MHKSYLNAAACVIFATALFTSASARADIFDGLDVDLVGSSTLPTTGPFAGDLYLTPSQTYQVGAAWLDNPVPTNQAFSTQFGFVFTNPGSFDAGGGDIISAMADGVALIFQGTGTSALGSTGAELGVDIPNSTTTGGSVDAVFQTFNQTHGFVTNTTSTASGPFAGAPDFSSYFPVLTLAAATNIQGVEQVSYDPVTDQLTQDLLFFYTIGGMTKFLTLPTQTTTVDLAALFGPTMTVGLSASTGRGSSDQVINAWTAESSPVPEPGTWAMSAIGAALLLGFARVRRHAQA